MSNVRESESPLATAVSHCEFVKPHFLVLLTRLTFTVSIMKMKLNSFCSVTSEAGTIELGLGPAAVKLYLELWQRAFFKDISSVVEMGAQELHLTPADFEELIRIAGVPNLKKKTSLIWPIGPEPRAVRPGRSTSFLVFQSMLALTWEGSMGLYRSTLICLSKTVLFGVAMIW